MFVIEDKPYWNCPGGKQVKNEDFKSTVSQLVKRGANVYVGTDSMIKGDNCIFATVVAFHNNDEKIGTYFYKKFRVKHPDFRNLQKKITEEVNLSVQAAQKMSEYAPYANIEVHVDIGINKGNKTKTMMPVVSGWVAGMGFDLKIKPDAWAAFGIADNHTK